MKNKSKSWILGLCALGLIANAGKVNAEGQYAGKERSTVAKAHMSRARSLMVEALEEFEEARKYARPDLLLDSEDWRLRVISLTEQLNRVIDPRPRVTREGAVFRVPPRLIKRERDNLPVVADGAKSRSDFGERAKMEGKQAERAQLYGKEGKKEPLRVTSNQLPADLAVPDEPTVLKEAQDPLKKKNAIDEKALFTQELMPQIEANKEVVKKEKENKIIKVVGDVRVPDKEDAESLDEIESIKEDADLMKKLPTVTEEKKVEVVEDVKVTKDADLVGEELSPDEARKQLSEDEELTKRLDETINNRIGSGK